MIQQTTRVAQTNPEPTLHTHATTQGYEPTVLTNIYQDTHNIAIWKRDLSDDLVQATEQLLNNKPTLQMALNVSAENNFAGIHNALGETDAVKSLSQDLSKIVEMFCYLFELKRAGLRLTALDKAMCPRFHVDRVPARLVTTYQGKATEWLAHHLVDRSKLGTGNQGKPDHESGIYQQTEDISQLSCGDVALLKGELWEGNENAGLVHRSPKASPNEKRLLLTLDFITN